MSFRVFYLCHCRLIPQMLRRWKKLLEFIKNKTPIGQEVVLTFLSRDNILTNLKDFDYNFDDCHTHTWENISHLITEYIKAKHEQNKQNNEEEENNE